MHFGWMIDVLFKCLPKHLKRTVKLFKCLGKSKHLKMKLVELTPPPLLPQEGPLLLLDWTI